MDASTRKESTTQLTMKKITFSAEEEIIEKARLLARAQGKSLNTAFREWLTEFTAPFRNARKAERLMRRLGHVKAGRHFTRDEMNES
jgi:hypothetical protein